VLIIYGLVATEIAAVHAGALPAGRMLPTWVLQAGLLALFAGAYHYPALARRLAA
jgi:type VI protein secretion system component VasF